MTAARDARANRLDYPGHTSRGEKHAPAKLPVQPIPEGALPAFRAPSKAVDQTPASHRGHEDVNKGNPPSGAWHSRDGAGSRHLTRSAPCDHRASRSP